MIKSAFEAYGREMDPAFEYQFTALRKTHNQGYLTSIPRICCAVASRGC